MNEKVFLHDRKGERERKENKKEEAITISPVDKEGLDGENVIALTQRYRQTAKKYSSIHLMQSAIIRTIL